jgi:acylphosphatase
MSNEKDITAMNRKAFKATIHGMVQGVGFRYFTVRKAHEHSVTGYVRNLPDGSVETYAEGEKEVLEQFLAELKKGPWGASVEAVEVDWKSGVKNYKEFSITY